MKNAHVVAILTVVALLLSGSAFPQTVFKAVTVPGSSPNSLIALNDSSQVVVNTGNSDSYQVSVWSRTGGSQSLGLSGTSGGSCHQQLWRCCRRRR